MATTPAGNDSIRPISFCPLCDTRYQAAQARVLAEEGETRLVHVTCRKCGGATLSLLMQSDAGASTVGMVTDLSHEDAVRFRRGRRVSTDDVIEAHELLAKGLASAFDLTVRKRRVRAKAPVKSRRAV